MHRLLESLTFASIFRPKTGLPVVVSPPMHELGLMTNLLSDAVAAAHGEAICAMNVRVGPLSGIVVDSLHFAFEALSPGTLAEGARLHIHETEISFHCPHCDAKYSTPVGLYQCPTCHSTDGELCGGNELELISIEVSDHV